MKELPPTMQNKVNDSLAIIKRKSPERRTLIIGISLCAGILLLLFLVGLETASISARIEGARYIVKSPVDGLVVELPFAEGSRIQNGDALLRFDPSHIREQNSIIRGYLTFFQENRHNSGTLKQKFKPLLGDIFDTLNAERKVLLENETKAQKLYQQGSYAHSRLQLQMRNPANHDEKGLPREDFVAKEKQASLDMKKLEESLQKASLIRATLDKKIRKISADLNSPFGILYRYLEEQHKEVQSLIRNEYLYANTSGKMGKVLVSLGEYVKKDTALYEIMPENSGDWWVYALFDPEDATRFTERELCTVITEDGLEFDARIVSITPKGENTLISLFVQGAPEGIEASDFAKVVKK